MKTFLQAVFGAIALLLATEPAEARKVVSQLPAEVCTSNLNATVGLLTDQPVTLTMYTRLRWFECCRCCQTELWLFGTALEHIRASASSVRLLQQL